MIELSDLLQATGGQLHTPAQAEHWPDFCHDSRLAEPGQLFVALRTPTGDGHDHIAEAVARGCTGILCQHPVSDHPPVTTILVPESGDALRAWAAHILRQIAPLVIAITGSSGKTTAKELAADLLERRYPGQVFRTRHSYNDGLGIPLALARLRPEHRLAVIEIGADAHGEIAQLAALVRPTIAAVTIINDAHLGAFGSTEALAAEKLSLLNALPPHGLAILNAADPHQNYAGPAIQLAHSSSDSTPIRLTPTEDVSSPDQLLLTLDHPAIPTLDPAAPSLRPSLPASLRLSTNLLGDHQHAAIRTAIAIAAALGVSPEDIAAGIAAFQPLPGRLRPLPGVNGSLLLDDTYSANPAATGAALRTLADFPSPRLAILGQHSGLGQHAEPLLEALGPDIAACADHLVTVGPQALIIARAATAAGMNPDHIHHADTPAAAAELARALIGGRRSEVRGRESAPRSSQKTPATRPPPPALRHSPPATQFPIPNFQFTILLKGSREARLERTTALLLADPATAADVLPRHDPGWQNVRLRNSLRPTWVEIDTLAIADNLRAARSLLAPGVQLIAVLKADAYGHGAPTVARIATQVGVDLAAVACLPEAQTLRRAAIDLPILILGYTPPWQTRPALELDLHLTVYDPDVAAALDQAAAALGKRASVHVKVDTGMGRLGLLPADAPDFLRHLRSLPNLDVTGLFTHMAAADDPADPHTGLQLDRFADLLAELDRCDLRPPLVHAANTAALLTRPRAHYDAVRLGIGLYGLSPAPDLALPPDFRPALSWKTTIAQVKTLPPGSPVGYGLSYRTEAEQTIAIIPVGYADGFRRAPRNWGHVLVRGQRAPLVGRVSMDQAAIDVTAIPGVRPGDEVVLIGRQGEQNITADDVAERLGTINYEVISAILARVPRLPE